MSDHWSMIMQILKLFLGQLSIIAYLYVKGGKVMSESLKEVVERLVSSGLDETDALWLIAEVITENYQFYKELEEELRKKYLQ